MSSTALYMHAVIGALALATFAAEWFATPARARPFEPFAKGGASGGRKLVVVHAAWCGHCTRLLAPGGVWSQVKRQLPGVAVQEIDEADAPDLVQALNIGGFPDIRVLDGKHTVATFKGERNASAIAEFALKHIK